MSFKFEVGQEVIRIDLVTGAPWGATVIITHRTVLVLPGHNICEKRYVFKDSGYSCEFPESALKAIDAVPIERQPSLGRPQSQQQSSEGTTGRIVRSGGFTPKPKKLSWWSWLFND